MKRFLRNMFHCGLKKKGIRRPMRTNIFTKEGTGNRGRLRNGHKIYWIYIDID